MGPKSTDEPTESSERDERDTFTRAAEGIMETVEGGFEQAHDTAEEIVSALFSTK